MIGSVRIWKVWAIALFLIIQHTCAKSALGFDDDVDVESWVSKSQLFPIEPLEYENVRKSVLGMALPTDDFASSGARRANPPSISSRSRVEMGPGMLKSPILKYPPKYFQNKLKHLIKLQNRKDELDKMTPKSNKKN